MNLVEDIFNKIRFSSELGEGSCSTVDECYSDEELRQRIETEISDFAGLATVDNVFEAFLDAEKVYWEHQRELEVGYGGGDYERPDASEMAQIAREVAEAELESKSSCGGCGRQGSFYDGLCYQCQCEYHAVGAYDMDGGGW